MCYLTRRRLNILLCARSELRLGKLPVPILDCLSSLCLRLQLRSGHVRGDAKLSVSLVSAETKELMYEFNAVDTAAAVCIKQQNER